MGRGSLAPGRCLTCPRPLVRKGRRLERPETVPATRLQTSREPRQLTAALAPPASQRKPEQRAQQSLVQSTEPASLAPRDRRPRGPRRDRRRLGDCPRLARPPAAFHPSLHPRVPAQISERPGQRRPLPGTGSHALASPARRRDSLAHHAPLVGCLTRRSLARHGLDSKPWLQQSSDMGIQPVLRERLERMVNDDAAACRIHAHRPDTGRGLERIRQTRGQGRIGTQHGDGQPEASSRSMPHAQALHSSYRNHRLDGRWRLRRG